MVVFVADEVARLGSITVFVVVLAELAGPVMSPLVRVAVSFSDVFFERAELLMTSLRSAAAVVWPALVGRGFRARVRGRVVVAGSAALLAMCSTVVSMAVLADFTADRPRREASRFRVVFPTASPPLAAPPWARVVVVV